MGIRKGWALCGAREKHCFISHAVSSHPLLELQTLGLFTLFSPHHQDLSLDSIQFKKKKKKNLPSFPPPLPLCFFFNFVSTITLPATSTLVTNNKTGTLWWPIPFIISLTFLWEEKRKSWPDSGGARGQGAHFFFATYFLLSSFFFCSLALPPDCLSVDIIPDSADANDVGGDVRGGGDGGGSSSSSSLLVFFCSLGRAGVVWPAEARWEITGMGSH